MGEWGGVSSRPRENEGTSKFSMEIERKIELRCK